MVRRVLPIAASLAILALVLAHSPCARARQNASRTPPANSSPAAADSTSSNAAQGYPPATAPSGDSNSAEPDPAALREAEERFEGEVRAAEAKLNPNQNKDQNATSAQRNTAGQPSASPGNAASASAKETASHPATKTVSFGADLNPPLDSGIPIRNVRAGTRAEKAGLKSGDVITHFDGKQVRSVSDFCDHLKASDQAKTVRLGITRGKARLSVLLPPADSKSTGAIRPSAPE